MSANLSVMAQRNPNHFDLVRIQNLTDGIFAVSMTVLVLDIRLAPDVVHRDIAHGLLNLIPSFYSYVISFFVLALFWWVYHRVAALLERADSGFVWWNIVFLFSVTLAPFTAHLLGAFYGARIATEIYCLNLMALSVLLSVLWSHAAKHQLIDSSVDGARRNVVTVRLFGTTVIYLCTIAVGFLFPDWFWLGFAATIPVRLFERRMVRLSIT